MELREQIEKLFHTEIPITRAMGVRLLGIEDEAVELMAPLALNGNHLGTAFGGSLHTVATLAGYAIVWILLRRIREEGHVLIRKSEMDFRHTVRGDLIARAPLPAKEVRERFERDYHKKNKARLFLEVSVISEGIIAAAFTGEFVAVTKGWAPNKGTKSQN